MTDAPMDNIEQAIADRMTVDWLLSKLSPMDREIVYLWAVEDYTLEEIGRLVGPKYRGQVLPGSTIRYRKESIRRRLQDFQSDL